MARTTSINDNAGVGSEWRLVNGRRAAGSYLSADGGAAVRSSRKNWMGPPRLSISSIWRPPPEHALGRAEAVLSHDTSKELRPDKIPPIRNARLLQFTAAGVDWVPTRDLPR